MNRFVRALCVGFGAFTLGIVGCGPSHTASGSGDDDGGDDDTGPGPGPDPTPVTTCAASCTTDLPAARSALTAGNYQQAFDLYRCADNPEAAFGAGLTRVLLAFEGNNADLLLADLGQPPLPATDVFGADGILAREAARWNGEGSLTLSGGLSVALPFARAQQQISTDGSVGLGMFVAEAVADPSHAELNLSFNGDPLMPITSGTALAVTTTCTGTYPLTTIDPRLEYLDLWFDVGTAQYSCSIPYSQPAATCQADGGSIVVVSAPSGVGQSASYEFRNLMLSCYDGSSDVASEDLVVRVSGTVSATAVSDTLDTSGLHPIFASDIDLASQIPAGRMLTDVMQHAGGAGAELEEAACFFDIAGKGTGHVFDVPGVLFGGSDVPISKGDAEILASLSLAGAALGHLAWMHEISMPLGRLLCDDTEGQATCPTDQQYVTEFNDAFSSTFHGGRLPVVQRLVGQALPLLDRGLADLDGSSLFVRNSASTAGLDALRTLVQAAEESFANGEIPLPQVTPAILVDFRELFGTARNPKSAGPVLRYVETVEEGEVYTSVELNQTFLQRYFAGRIDADWENGDYEWTASETASDALEELGSSTQRYLVVGD